MIRESHERDNSTLTVGRVARSPKNIAKVIFFYVFLTLFKVCLIAMIRVNSVTFMDFDFHCRAMELLYIADGLLTMKDAR
jgi:hypothetical protein